MSNNTKYVRDAFKSLELVEDKEFDLFGKDSFEELGDFIDTEDDVEVEQEVIDLDANEPEELKDSYVGDVILSCPVCHANMFKEIGDVVIDEETELCCVGDPCPVCGQEDGFKVIGKVAPFEEVEEEEETEVEVETEPEEAEAEVEVKEKVRESFKKRVADKRLQEKRTPAHRKLMEKVCKDCGKEVCECDKEEKPAKKPIRIKATGNMVEIPIEKKDRPLKEEKGDLNKLDKDIQDIVGDHFGYTMNFDFLDIVADVLLRVDDFENDLWETVDSTLIYADDQWEVLEHYFDSPADLSDGSWDDAFAQFVGDIEEICRKVVAQKGGEEVSESKKLKEGWRGSKEIEMVSHGSWGDPDLVYKGYTFNYWDIEDALWNDFLEDTGHKDSDSNDPAVEDEFDKYVQLNAPGYLDDYIANGAPKNWHREALKRSGNKKLSESKYQIKEVSSDEAGDIINNRKPLGLFLQKDGNVFVAIDNSTGDAWTEEFKNRKSAEKWLLSADESLKKPTKGKKLSEAVSDYAKEDIKREIERIVDEYFKGTDFFVSVSNIDFDAGKVTLDISALGGYDENSDEVEELNREVEFDIPNLDLEDYFAAQLEDWMNTHNSPDNFYESKELTEAPVYDLNPQFDSRKSFYSKAKVDTGNKGDKNKLYSYNTLVAELKDGKPVVYGTFSSTTLRHIKDWLKQLGFRADNAKQIMADYGVKDESLKTDGKSLTESGKEQITVKWGDVFNERQQGRLASLKGQKIDRGTAEQISNAVASHLAKKNFELKDLMPKIDFDNETFICNVEKEKEMSLGEDIEKATIETEDQVIKVSSEPKEEDMNADWFDRESMGEGELLPDDGEEMIAPLDDEDIQEIEAAQEEPEENAEEPAETEEENPEDEEEFEFDEIQEESFKRITESYLKKVYSNVRSFKINNLDVNENLLKIDGTIRFNSGKKKDTSFVFESAKNENTIAKSKKRFVGLNETFTDKKDAFVLNTVVNNKKFIAESLSYDYPAKTKDLNESVKIVKGIVK